MKKLLLLGCFLFLTWLAGALSTRAAFLAGDAPTPIIEDSRFTMKEPMAHHREILMASFNSLDVVGRPGQTGKDNPRKRRVTPEHFKRIPAPDANACISCHYLPYAGGGGEAPGGNG